jgi:RimJ/RimL family protein N-acetyltransferase
VIVAVRQVQLHEWRLVRDLRIAAVSDPDAAQAFVTTRDEELARSEAGWRDRTAQAALGETAAQFVAVAQERGVGSVTALLRGLATAPPTTADLVGVWIAPDHRGTGLLGRLVDAAAQWAATHDVHELGLSVHRDNARAQAAYRKLGFTPTGEAFTSSIGPEIRMRRPH